MHQRRVAFAPHGLDHAQRGQRIDEARGAFGRAWCRPAGQAVGGPSVAVLRVHGAAEDRDGLAQQVLRVGARP